jgi:hypothetical protein
MYLLGGGVHSVAAIVPAYGNEDHGFLYRQGVRFLGLPNAAMLFLVI